MINLINKIGQVFLVFALVGTGVMVAPSSSEASCGEIPYGFVTAGLSVTDETTAMTGNVLGTSGFPVGPGTMDYTPGGDLYIEVTAGGNQQQEDPVSWSLTLAGSSTEGSYFSDYSYGNSVPSFSITLHNVNAGSISLSATQCSGDTAYVDMNLNELATEDFSLSCSPATATVTQGSSTSYSLITTAENGFNSPVTFTSSITGSGNHPTYVTYTNNNATPSAVTTAVVGTSIATSANLFTITFTGTGGGVTKTCQTQLQVNAQPPGFSLAVSPSSTSVVKGANAVYTVTANCTGSFSGPVTNLAASSFYTNVTYTFSSSSVACGQSVTLTVNNTTAVPSNQLSTPQSALSQTITVTGQGN